MTWAASKRGEESSETWFVLVQNITGSTDSKRLLPSTCWSAVYVVAAEADRTQRDLTVLAAPPSRRCERHDCSVRVTIGVGLACGG